MSKKNAPPMPMPNPYSYREDISGPMNRLKAQLYSFVEASFEQPERANAAKNLIKGFCNEEYRRIVTNVEDYLIRFEILNPEGISSARWIAEPLEVEQRNS